MNLYESDPLENIKRMKPFELESLRFAEESLEQFESKLDWFLSGNSDLVTLFKADFQGVQESGSVGYAEPKLEFIAPKGRGRVRRGVLTSGFYLLFKDCLKTSIEPPLIEHSEVLPLPFTDGLKKFIVKYPTLKTNVTSAIYDVSSSKDETDLIIARKYCHPETNRSIAEIWQAERILDLDVSEEESLIVKHPAFSFRR